MGISINAAGILVMTALGLWSIPKSFSYADSILGESFQIRDVILIIIFAFETLFDRKCNKNMSSKLDQARRKVSNIGEAAFLVKNVTALLSYVILAQITPFYLA